jgi:alpha-glucosidase
MRDLIDPIPWWKHAVCYQVYVRSFADSDGDGVGDLPGITSRLPYLADLGVDALWITPFYPSPQHDHGYDVAEYCGVDPLFGSLADADALLTRARELGLRVIVDLVPNHTSDEHAWFRAAREAPPGSPERARYLFRDGRGEHGAEPPNNWHSVFGGSAWDRLPATAEEPEPEWFLHIFDSTQPDLDWRNPEVAAMFEDVLAFWLDRGVDGFRVDVAHGRFKEASLRDQVRDVEEEGSSVNHEHGMVERTLTDEPMWDQPEVHEVYRVWRKILDSYPGDRMAVAEAWTQTAESMARFVRPDELHQTFNFAWLMADWSAEQFADVVRDTFATLGSASPTWVLSNHDVVRHVTRYGGGERGLARARAATLAMLAMPGSAYLYQGEELGLEQQEVAPEHRQDPSWFRTGEPGRDGCRVPVPWSGDAPPYGFGPSSEQPWIPQPTDWADLTVAAQERDDASTLAFYKRALLARREIAAGTGDEVEVVDSSPLGEHVLELRRGPLLVAVNCGEDPATLPDGEVVLASGPLNGDGSLPPDTAAWIR